MDGVAFIRELCIALEHRWNPGALFLLFTAYFDEADTHGPSPDMVMAAFLGEARQWQLFQRKLRNLQNEHGFDIFHGKEIRGYGAARGMKIVSSLTDLVKNELTEGVCIQLPHEQYLNEYRKTPTPKGISLDSQYGVCFRMLLSHIVDLLTAKGKKHRLHIIIERGHPKAFNTEAIFNEIKHTLKVRGVDLLGTWTPAAKAEAPSLMVADLLAHTYALMRRPGGMGVRGYAEPAPEPPKNEAGLTFLELPPGALLGLKSQMQGHRWERQAYARRQKLLAKRRLSSEAPPCGGQPC